MTEFSECIFKTLNMCVIDCILLNGTHCILGSNGELYCRFVYQIRSQN
jgi:hypothetical protein